MEALTQDWPEDAVFTVGHSTLSAEAFVNLLQSFAVRQLADIRTIPRSRHNPQFSSETLKATLEAAQIRYIHLKALGGLRRARPDSPNTAWRNGGFRGYADYMQTPEFQAALQKLIALSKEGRTAIMCAEAVPWRCHRSLVADALSVRGIPVVEILPEGRWRMHALTPFAKVKGQHITYPGEQLALL